jgi:hypothetical protein
MEPLFYVSRGKIGEVDIGKRDYRYHSRTGYVENRWISTCRGERKETLI